MDFLPGVPKTIPGTAVRPTAVPGMVRGFAALHAKYGKLRWAQLVSPAENLARFGTRVSRAFASDFKRMPPAMLAETEIQKIFFQNQERRPIREGDFLKQLDLSGVLGRLRARGAGDFYNGPLARQLVAAVTRGGGSLTLADLRAYLPRWRPTLKIPYIKDTKFHVPMTSGPSSVLVAQMMGMLIENGDWEDSSPAERAHLMAEVTGRAFAYRGRWLLKDGNSAIDPRRLVSEDSIRKLIAGFRPDRHLAQGNVNSVPAEKPGNPAGTGFVVADRNGSAVACALSLNNLFGSGRVAEGLGIVLAALPGPMGRGPDSLAVIMLVGEVFNIFYYAAAASGGSVAPSALVAVTANTLMGRIEESLEKALAAKRVHNGGVPDLTYYEQGLDAATVKNLTRRGHRLSSTPAIGLVNALFCPSGIPIKERASCSIRNDPRGFGLASGAE
ncbi:MAG: gamma-glutamyltransferase [Proteobacteria bacterium]|nr:gamma-glutamyltransferase [Pseudomonadota bacterium]